MRKPPPLTAEQRAALAFANKQGGKLHRTEAGWGAETFDAKATSFVDLFAFSTVRALVTHGAMRWSLHDRRGGSLYPVEASVVEAQR